MDDFKAILEFVWAKGWVAVLMMLVILLVHDPDRAEKLKELLLFPFFRLFGRGARQYMAAKIGYTTTEFFKRSVHQILPSTPDVKVKIKWVQSPSDPTLNNEGSLVLYLRDTNDQSRNIMAAVQVALPRIVCPTMRQFIAPSTNAAIDLTLLKKLSENLGKHAKPVFQRYFLALELAGSQEVGALFQKLNEMDASGTFVAIFLEELHLLGETLFTSGITTDKTKEVGEFIEYLLGEARREKHEEIVLDHISREFKVGIILLAIGVRAENEGVTPYVRRLDQYIKLGCDSVYIIAYPPAINFLDRILKAIDSDNRISLAKLITATTQEPGMAIEGKRRIALLRRTPLFSDTAFPEKLQAAGIIEGRKVPGKVFDVSNEVALIDVKGLNGVIQKRDCSWRRTRDCHDVLASGTEREFIVKKIDAERCSIGLSLRDPDLNPWNSPNLPDVGASVEVEIIDCNGTSYFGLYRGDIEVEVPRTEVSWMEVSASDDLRLLNTRQRIIIIEVSRESQILKGSVRRTVANPWPEIHKALPIGTELHGTVSDVNEYFVRVSLPNGLQGIVPRECMAQAGFEYADYGRNVVVGQGLDVVVTKVFLEKKKIRLDLKRNQRNNQTPISVSRPTALKRRGRRHTHE